jgi:single-stranded-DNA-specific exonuclease
MQLIRRDAPPRAIWALEQAGIHPLLAQLYAARGVRAAQELDTGLQHLLPPDTLKGAATAAHVLALALEQDLHLCIVADYDCDGATACAVGLRGLRALGAHRVSYVVPDRLIDGYGLTPGIARRVHATGAQVLITVDNGIASVEGVATAQALGLQVVITDHHLPGVQLPAADVIVNPNQPGCSFASKNLAGVGVMFYVLLALRAALRQRDWFNPSRPLPKLDNLLPLVALGTVADVVRLDANNRRLVAQGLQRIRKGHFPVGLQALFQLAGRQPTQATSQDFGFGIGPRINAAGRLSDMTLGIECLSTDDPERARALAQQLDTINRDRREIEGDMREQALRLADEMIDPDEDMPSALCVYDPDFHEGVVGIVAARLKERHHRPVFVWASSQAPGKQNILKGSGRSIAGFHLRDALDWIAKKHPHLLLQFGGHAMAAGCSIHEDNLALFEQALQDVAQAWLDPVTLTRQVQTDGPLAPEHCRVDLVQALQSEVWGQGFAAPTFSETLDVVNQRIVGEKHLALKLRHHGQPVDGIWFGRTAALPARVSLAYRVETDEWQGQRRVRFVIEAAEEPERVE